MRRSPRTGLILLTGAVTSAGLPGASNLQSTPLARVGVAAPAGWVKYAGNPVLGGRLGTCFDVCVLKEGQVFTMWFSWRPARSIACTQSSDGIHWGMPEIVLGPNPASRWEDDVNRPVVIRSQTGYQMWYTGQAAGRSAIGYAVSVDGSRWKRQSQEPVLKAELPWENAAVMCPDVMRDKKQNLYRMWYSGGEQGEPNAIGYAASRDGLHWKKWSGNPIMKPIKSLAWEQDRVTACHVLQQSGWCVMFFIGFRDEAHAQIGVARSRNGIDNWQRLPANPIIQPEPGAWDQNAVYKPYALFDRGRWMLWYNGRSGGLEQIGLATHVGRSLGF